MSVTWRGRLRTAAAMAQLFIAVLVVWCLPLRMWRGLLGDLTNGPQPAPTPPGTDQLKTALAHSLHVSRAANYFPFTVKCLPQAMVLQWQLGRRCIGSQLVIAMLKSGRSAEADPYHAWVELGGIILLGNCERSDYAVLMTLTNPPA